MGLTTGSEFVFRSEKRRSRMLGIRITSNQYLKLSYLRKSFPSKNADLIQQIRELIDSIPEFRTEHVLKYR